MKRFHIHVGVEKLDESIRFYSALFGAEPVKRKPDYAQWLLDDPRVNFAISTRVKKNGMDHLLEEHRAALESDGRLEERRRKNLTDEVFAVASSRASAHLRAAVAGDPGLQRVLARVEERELDPLSAVRQIVEEVFELDGADDR